jgi:hypothetical protein
MKKSLLCFLIIANILCFGQLRKADANIQKLNNDQFIIDHSQKASFKFKSNPALKLIKTGKPATDKLINALDDSTKTIMVHLVLCHIYFKQVSFAGPKVLVTDKGDLNKYYLGEEKGEGLVISETNTDGKYSAFVLPGDRREIIEYWKLKLKKYNTK